MRTLPIIHDAMLKPSCGLSVARNVKVMRYHQRPSSVSLYPPQRVTTTLSRSGIVNENQVNVTQVHHQKKRFYRLLHDGDFVPRIVVANYPLPVLLDRHQLNQVWIVGSVKEQPRGELSGAQLKHRLDALPYSPQ
jgi:hypothetical protein